MNNLYGIVTMQKFDVETLFDSLKEEIKSIVSEFQIEISDIKEIHLLLSTLEENKGLSNAVYVDIENFTEDFLDFLQSYIEYRITVRFSFEELLSIKISASENSDLWGNIALEKVIQK